MILRSQLRMNKAIVFPFISCIMIMFTLLVLIHKSTDELNAVKKELSQCNQQHDLVYTQLQNAIKLKSRLEELLENEKTEEKQKIDELQNILNEEKEARQKDQDEYKKAKEEAENRYSSLKQLYEELQDTNKQMKGDGDDFRKKLIEKEDENQKLSNKLKETESSDAKLITELREKIKILEGAAPVNRKATPEFNPIPPAAEVNVIPSSLNGSTTPGINPQAILNQDDSPKGVAPPPNNADPENSIQTNMRNSLNMKPAEESRLNENVIKSPIAKPDENANNENGGELVDDKKSGENSFDKMPANMNLPLPLNLIKRVSVAGNNAAQRENRLENQPQDVLAPPLQNDGGKVNEISKDMKDFAVGEDYAQNGEEDADDDYVQDKNDQSMKLAAQKNG